VALLVRRVRLRAAVPRVPAPRARVSARERLEPVRLEPVPVWARERVAGLVVQGRSARRARD